MISVPIDENTPAADKDSEITYLTMKMMDRPEVNNTFDLSM